MDRGGRGRSGHGQRGGQRDRRGGRGDGRTALNSFIGATPNSGAPTGNFNHFSVLEHLESDYRIQLNAADKGLDSSIVRFQMRSEIIEGAGGVTVETLLEQLDKLKEKK